MTLSLTQSLTALGPSLMASFLGVGGVEPYTYAVLGGGAGGSINASTGEYTAPATVPTTAAQQYDTIQVTDSTSPTPLTVTAKIMVGDHLLLFCDVIETAMGLSPGRVFVWDQKLFMPSDNGLFVVVTETDPKPIGNINEPSTSGTDQQQFVAWKSRLDVNLVSRDNSARLMKTAFLAALNSAYAWQQQELNSFLIAKSPLSFRSISVADGAAIPYRYQVSLNIQYAEALVSAQPYISSFSTPTIATNA